MNKIFFGSKLNSVLLAILIVLVLFAILIMAKNPDTYLNVFSKKTITKDQAEQIAGPILKKCWHTDKMDVVSFSTSLVNYEMNDGKFKKAWRVGGNYYEKDFGYTENTRYGYIPEVAVDAYTGGILSKHFEEIVENPIKECNN